MNIYTVEFFSRCPMNGVRVQYRLRIETTTMVPVEQLLAAVESLYEGFHEEHADALFNQFGGAQTLTAHHHGVDLETRRGSLR